MNKKLTSFLVENNFSLEQEGAYSYINDYQVSIGQDRMQNAIYGSMDTVIQIYSHLEIEQMDAIKGYLKEMKKSLSITKYEVTQIGVCFVIVKHYDTLLDRIKQITSYMISQNAKNKEYCPVTGDPLDEETKKKLYYNNLVIFLNAVSVDIINSQIEQEEEEFQAAPNNYAKGLLGAFVGGALGAIVWVVLGALTGIISGWIAFLIAVLAGLGYDKMKGKPTHMKFVFSAIATLIYAVVSMFVIYILLVRSLMITEGISGNPVSLLFELVSIDEEVRSGFIMDMVLSLFFGILGIGFSYLQMRKSFHQKQEKLK
ncbi:MAG: hypothetical protein K2N64_00330 [Anaeroplasmataceae bacterium]|nr:hypothetical protein [Anaeroplasmataceae bacterium]